MKAVATLTALLLLAAASGSAAASGNKDRGSHLLRMEELEIHGESPLRMEELEVRGIRDTADVLYLPAHRGIELPSPVRYDLFLEDMERPVFPREISPGIPPADGAFAPRGAP